MKDLLTGKYKYYCILIINGVKIGSEGRADSIEEYKAKELKHHKELRPDLDIEIVEVHKRQPETTKPKNYTSFACLDMGQASEGMR